MGRPKGSKGKVSRELRTVLDRLQREEIIHPAQWFKRLEEIALSAAPDRIAALRILLGYAYGLPRATVAIEAGLSKSTEDLLREIASSEAHRQILERLEQKRLRAAPTVEILPAEQPGEEMISCQALSTASE